MSDAVEWIKIIVPALVGFGASFLPFLNKWKKDSRDVDLSYYKQITEQYNHVVERLDKLESEKVVLTEENMVLKDKVLRLEYKLSDEFNHLAAMQSFFEHLPRPAWLKSTEGIVYYINSSCEEELKVPKLLYEGQTDEVVWGKEVAGRLREKDLEVIELKKAVTGVDTLPVSPGSDVFNSREVIRWPVTHKGTLIGVGGLVCRTVEAKEDGNKE